MNTNEKINYQLILDKTIAEHEKRGERPRLLLHACCAPCSSYVLEYLSRYFDITLLFFNPNISPQSEYDLRANELGRLISDMGLGNLPLITAEYTPELFEEIAAGLEDAAEGGERCRRCYRLRLENAARAAKECGYDYFTTTLSISPHKNAQWLNAIGLELGEKYEMKYLCSDFKKEEGYKRSCQLSKEYNLYRQDYCGCKYSKENAECGVRNEKELADW
jgi:predicted adenine nucleotide alpha hydrolase (AANH) superfamily ATPase